MQQTNNIVAYPELLAFLTDIPREAAVAGVIFQQMRHARSVGQLINGDHTDFCATAGLIQRTNYVAPDATEAINRYA